MNVIVSLLARAFYACIDGLHQLTIVVLNDVHNMDKLVSWQVIEALFDTSKNVLVICTAKKGLCSYPSSGLRRVWP